MTGQLLGVDETGDVRLGFDRRVRLEFHGSKISSDGDLLLFRELDEVLGLHDIASGVLRDTRMGHNRLHTLVGLLRQSVFGRLAGYEDVNDADRLVLDPVMRQVVGERAVDAKAAPTSQMGQFETEVLLTSNEAYDRKKTNENGSLNVTPLHLKPTGDPDSMKMIVTGTSGFIGSHLLKAARAAYGSDVTAFSSIVDPDSPDLTLTPTEFALVKEAKVLIHAGAFVPKSGAEVNHIAKCNGNITFTEKLLALPWNNLKKIVFISSSDVYANVDGPISEATPTVPTSLYGLSKFYGERMVSAFAADHGVFSQLLRIGHVYGPGEEQYAKVIPKAIQNIVAGKDVELWGEGEELRSFIYADDVVTAILNGVELQEDPGVINVVSSNSISIRDLLEKLVTIGGRDTGIVRREFSGTTRDLVFDNAKLKRYLLAEESDFTEGLQAELRHIQNQEAKPKRT